MECNGAKTALRRLVPSCAEPPPLEFGEDQPAPPRRATGIAGCSTTPLTSNTEHAAGIMRGRQWVRVPGFKKR